MTGSSRANGLKRFANGTELIPQRDKFLIPSVYDSHILVLKMEKKASPQIEIAQFLCLFRRVRDCKKAKAFQLLRASCQWLC